MKVDLVVNGLEGLIRMGRKTYDVAFIDFQMPFMGGIEMASLVRNHANARLAKTPLIATTGFAHYFESNPLVESNFDDFIVKPHTTAMVLSCLQRILLTKVRPLYPDLN
ncbi:MAG: response regulator [Oligoflexus sp.]|nr:response regulator [Oligoflexus sp.]